MAIKTIDRVWDFSKSSGSALIILLALADYCNDQDICWPGLDKLHVKARITKRQAQRVIESLEGGGELFSLSGQGRGNHSRYLVCVGLTENQITERLASGFDLTESEAKEKAARVSSLLKSQKVTPMSPLKLEKVTSETIKGDIQGNKSGHRDAQSGDNRIEPSLDPNTGEAPVAIAPAPAIDLLGLDEPVHSKPLEKAQQAKAIERLGEQPPSKEIPKEPSKVPLKVPAPTSEVKDALAILCYGTKDAWALNANKGQLGKVLKEIPGLTIEQLRTFFCNWYAKDWRGKRGDKPKPREVSAEWTILTTTPCSDETAAVLGSVASPSSGPNWIPDPDRPGMFIKPSQLRTRQAEVSHAS